MNLSQKIQLLRKRAGLSQEALSEKIGVSRQAISKWETGESTPELSKLPLLAQVFGVTTDWLLSDEPLEEPKPEEPEEPKTSAYSYDPQPSAPNAYPSWVDQLPGFLGQMLKRYGFLFGIYTFVSGLLFFGIGALARSAVRKMISSPIDMFLGDGFGGGMVVEGLPSDFPAELLPEITGHTSVVDTFAANNPVSMVGGFIMAVGAVLMIAGVILTLVLLRYRNK